MRKEGASDDNTATPRPWHKIGADEYEYAKQNYLIVNDYFSCYLEIAHLPDMTSKTIY